MLTPCTLHPQTARTQQPPPARPSASTATDPATIKQDEARLLAILAHDPENPGALAGMGWVRSRQRNYTAAVSYLERALRQRPSDPQLNFALNQARFQVVLAEAQHSLVSNELVAAQRFYSAALQIRPNSPEALQGVRAATARRIAATGTPAEGAEVEPPSSSPELARMFLGQP